MGCMTEVLLIFTACMAATALAVVKPISEADFDAIVEDSKQTSDTLTEDSCQPQCPFGWVKFDGRCFIYQSNSMDWASAENYCLNLDANLVSIHSETEHKLVKSLIRAYDSKENPTWLGLSNCQKRNSWIWSDGTRLTYTNWNPNEPNFSNNECCAHINWPDRKNWNDIPCGQSYPFVCAKKLTTKTSGISTLREQL